LIVASLIAGSGGSSFSTSNIDLENDARGARSMSAEEAELASSPVSKGRKAPSLSEKRNSENARSQFFGSSFQALFTSKKAHFDYARESFAIRSEDGWSCIDRLFHNVWAPATYSAR